MALARHAVYPLLFAYEWHTVARHARRGGTATDVSPRSNSSGAHHRWLDLLGGTPHGGGAVDEVRPRPFSALGLPTARWPSARISWCFKRPR